jgi:hypothetical protein
MDPTPKVVGGADAPQDRCVFLTTAVAFGILGSQNHFVRAGAAGAVSRGGARTIQPRPLCRASVAILPLPCMCCCSRP